MKILVIGAGALGGYFGARLTEVGADVTFLLRERRAQQIARTGIVLRSPCGDFHLPKPQTISRETLAAEKPVFDVILVGCKAYDLEDTMASFAPAVGAQTMIVPLLNGMSHVDTLIARFGRPHVAGGYSLISAAMNDEGEIIHYNDSHKIIFGELDGDLSPRIQAFAALCEKANFDGLASARIVGEMWEKWMRIATLAGMTCLMRGAIKDIVQAGGAPFALALFEECLAIALKNGQSPTPKSNDMTRKAVTDATSPVTASMFKDLDRGAPIEAKQLIGDLIALRDDAADGTDSGVKIGMLDVVYLHLRTYEVRREAKA